VGVDRSKLIRLVVLVAVGLLVAGALAAFAFIKSGFYNVAASKPHTKLTFWVTNETMIRSVKRHAKSVDVPPRFTAAQVERGFCRYETHCVACHGAPAVARQDWVSGLEPQPPYLLDATHKFTPRELFWIAKNGIKMTGMPSWKDAMSDAELWEVVAFLEGSRQLPPPTYVEWRESKRCSTPAVRMPQ
jgi:mono/diheme cytochrome c family protein